MSPTVNSISWISIKVPGYQHFRVFLNGLPVCYCVEAKAGDPYGYVIRHVVGLDNKPVLDENDQIKRTTDFGAVRIEEIPRSELASVVRPPP